MILRISGLPGAMNNDDFWQLVYSFGTVRTAHISFDRITYKSRRFGFVHMVHRKDGLRIIEVLNGKPMPTGQVLRVLEVQQKPV